MTSESDSCIIDQWRAEAINAFSIRSLMADKPPKTRPGHWLGSVLRVSFSVLILLLGDGKNIRSVKTLRHSSQRFLSGTSG